MKLNRNLIIILAASVIILSAWAYYMAQTSSLSSESDREFQEVTNQSSSDDPDSIEKDLENTDFENLDAELLEIEAELDSTGEAQTQ